MLFDRCSEDGTWDRLASWVLVSMLFTDWLDDGPGVGLVSLPAGTAVSCAGMFATLDDTDSCPSTAGSAPVGEAGAAPTGTGVERGGVAGLAMSPGEGRGGTVCVTRTGAVYKGVI